MTGLVPAIHVFDRQIKSKAWMPGTGLGMTNFAASARSPQDGDEKSISPGAARRHQ